MNIKLPVMAGGADSPFGLLIDRQTLDQMVRHAVADYPKEACGVVLVEGSTLVVRQIPNASRRPRTSYLFGPRETKALEGAALMAVYHSHTNGQVWLSDGDIQALAPSGKCDMPDVAQLVVTLFGPGDGLPASVTAGFWDPGLSRYRPARIRVTEKQAPPP